MKINALMIVKHSGPKATLQKFLASQLLKNRIYMQKNLQSFYF